MNGVVAVRTLLVNSASVTALVPAARIVPDRQALGIDLPAITLSDVSELALQTLVVGNEVFLRERIQVTALAYDYLTLVPLLDAIKWAAHGKSPTVSGMTNIEVRFESMPSRGFNDEAGFQFRPIDFMVSYTKTI